MISVILPCFNEAKNLPELYERLSCAFKSVKEEYELLFVDDGSTDDSLSDLRTLCQSDPKVRAIELSRNFGHQAALCAGLAYADGDAVIMMDADLQHPPELVPEMVEKWKQGYDIVYTVRNDLSVTPLFKKVTAKAFYKMINRLARIHIPENSADFRLLDRKVVEEFRGLKEKTKFFRGLINWVGFKQYPIQYDAAPRHMGNSKYTLSKMISFAFDGITSFSAFPLHIATILGMLVSILSFLYAGYAIYIKLFTQTAVAGWTSVLVAVLFLGGVQLLSLGIIGEYLNRVYTETKARPTYIVRNVHGNKPRL